MADKTFSPVRARASTVEAAVEQALLMAGVSRDEIEFEVLEETEKGAVVRIAPIGTLAPRPAAVTEVFEAAPVESEAESIPDAEVEPEVEEEETFAEDVVAEDVQDDFQDDEDEQEEEVETFEEEVPAAAPVREAPEIRVASPEVVEHARVLAQEMLDRMTLEAEAKIAELPAWCLPTSHDKSERVRDVPRAFLQIEGEDVGILIGKHGQTLQSFQYLLNLSLNNTTESEEASEEGVRNGGVHVIVDAGDYRGRRATALDRAAHEAAERAKRDRRAIRMEPMPGHERRLVHLALYDDKEITTSSDGREPWRRVVVTPAGMKPTRGEGEERGGNPRYNNERSGGFGNNRGGGRAGNGGGGNRGGRGGSGGGNAGGGRSGGFGSNSGSAGGGRRSYN